MSHYIGAIDQGTTSSRCIIFGPAGNIVSAAQKEHRQIFPAPGWVEHDGSEILANCLEVAGAALARAGLTAQNLAGIGLANQRETTLLWEKKTGRPLANAIVWMDARTEPLVRRFAAAGGAEQFRSKTGLPLTTYFSALKLAWLFENISGAREKAEAGEALFGTMDSWLAWNLCAGRPHITDVTNASRTMLMNLHTLDWDQELLDAFAIPRACLPEIRPSSGPLGTLAVPPLAGVPLAAMLGDQQAALVGQNCFGSGEAKNTYGTGAFLLMNTGREPIQSKSGLLTTLAYQFADAPAHYALEGAIAITGALLQWLRDNFGLLESTADAEALARGVPDNGDVYIVPAFSGLYAPYWQERARGVIAGLTRYATRAHLVRAALEATCYQVRDVVEAMQADSGIRLAALKVDGGMTANDFLLQFQADILNVPVQRGRIRETTALGGAYAAGLATGYWRHQDDLRANWQMDKVFAPEMPEETRARLYKSWQKAVRRSFDWID